MEVDNDKIFLLHDILLKLDFTPYDILNQNIVFKLIQIIFIDSFPLLSEYDSEVALRVLDHSFILSK